MDKHNLVISGIQGSGKGTQARLLEKVFKNHIHISTGDLCRWHVKNKTNFGQELSIIHEGKFVADSTIIKILEEKIKTLEPNQSFILDGFPRNLKQAQYLFQNHQITAVLHLDLKKDLAIKRTQKRLKQKESLRVDDTNLSIVEKRIQLYQKNNTPILDYFQEKKLLYYFSSNEEIDTIHQKIIETFNTLNLL